MKLSPGEQDSVVSLLTRIYLDLAAIETEHNLLAGHGDFRPRVEYFHDAVRALSDGDPSHRETGGRLSVELLAYDLSCLRFLIERPLSSFKPHAEPLSPKTDLVMIGETPVPKSKAPDRATKERLSDLYRHYAVLFAALFKTQADNDYHERADEMNQDVEDIHTLLAQIKELAAGTGKASQTMTLAGHMNDQEMRRLLEAFLQHKKYTSKSDTKKLTQFMKEQAAKKDRDIASVEAAHLNYVMGQLAIFENSKDMLKSMAGQGMNLVGKFVEASMAETRREMGR